MNAVFVFVLYQNGSFLCAEMPSESGKSALGTSCIFQIVKRAAQVYAYSTQKYLDVDLTNSFLWRVFLLSATGNVFGRICFLCTHDNSWTAALSSMRFCAKMYLDNRSKPREFPGQRSRSRDRIFRFFISLPREITATVHAPCSAMASILLSLYYMNERLRHRTGGFYPQVNTLNSAYLRQHAVTANLTTSDW